MICLVAVLSLARFGEFLYVSLLVGFATYLTDCPHVPFHNKDLDSATSCFCSNLYRLTWGLHGSSKGATY